MVRFRKNMQIQMGFEWLKNSYNYQNQLIDFNRCLCKLENCDQTVSRNDQGKLKVAFNHIATAMEGFRKKSADSELDGLWMIEKFI